MVYEECSADQCGNPVFSRGVCRKHYDLQRKAEADPCSTAGCTRPASRRGMCDAHYRSELKKRTKPCKVPGCEDGVKAQGYCDKHYQRFWKHGEVTQTRPNDWGAREAHPLYKSYVWHRRGLPKSMCAEWANDFWAFVETVGERPEGHKLRRLDPDEPLSPTNWHWKETTASTDKAYYARKWRDNNPRRARNSDLKKSYGITIDDF